MNHRRVLFIVSHVLKGVVYSFPCAACPHTYIGKTDRSLDHWLREHHCAEHVFSANHQVDLSKATVIDAHPHLQARCMLESWHIQHHQMYVNRGKGTLL